MQTLDQIENDPAIRAEKTKRLLDSLTALQNEIQESAARQGLTMREIAIDLGLDPDELDLEPETRIP